MKVSFSTPVIIRTIPEYVHSTKTRLLNSIEKYFILGRKSGIEINLVQNAQGKFICVLNERTMIVGQTSCVTLLMVLKIISYVTLIIPLLMLLAKFILRAVCCIDQLESGQIVKKIIPQPTKVIQSGGIPGFPNDMQVPSDTYGWLDQTMPSLLRPGEKPQDPNTLDETNVNASLKQLCEKVSKKESPDNARYLGDNDSLQLFELDRYPGVLFAAAMGHYFPASSKKADSEEVVRIEYEQIKKIKEELESDPLAYPHLYLPKSKLFTIEYEGEKRSFIAQEFMYNYSTTNAACVWKNKDRDLRPAVGELANLILKTGLNQIDASRYMPFKNEKGGWSLALVDVEEGVLDDKDYATNVDQGIVKLLMTVYSSESIKHIIAQVIAKYPEKEVYLRKEQRLAEQNLAVLHNFEQFCINHRIDSKELPSAISINDAVFIKLQDDLDLEEITVLENGTKITMKDAVIFLVKTLNEKIENREELLLSSHTHNVLYDPESMLDAPEGLGKARSLGESSLDLGQLWVRRILDVMVKHKIICSWNVSLAADTLDCWNEFLSIWLA